MKMKIDLGDLPHVDFVGINVENEKEVSFRFYNKEVVDTWVDNSGDYLITERQGALRESPRIIVPFGYASFVEGKLNNLLTAV